ncbi:hypothetical protein R3I94_004710 [Phoxinus phoxinus]|uniref:C-type lectin domain-containing protein n=1 Tax=Phoxinus phoxinus TaxID=58324 RepID=A0AAN9D922_9TELE
MWISATFLLFALAVNGVTKVSPELITVRKCPEGWEKFGTQCFKYVSDSKSWAEAEEQCVDLGGNLASVHSQITHNFLKTFVKKNSKGSTRTWIGAHDAPQEFIWFWSDGSKFEYNDWHTDEPNNTGGSERCVEMAYGGENRWNDAPCGTLLPFVCYRVARIEF